MSAFDPEVDWFEDLLVLPMLPSIYIAIFGTLYYKKIKIKSTHNNPFSTFEIFHMLSHSSIIGLIWAILIISLLTEDEASWAEILSTCILTISWGYGLMLLRMQFLRGLPNSYHLRGWWALSLLTATVKLIIDITSVVDRGGEVEWEEGSGFVLYLCFCIVNILGIEAARKWNMSKVHAQESLLLDDKKNEQSFNYNTITTPIERNWLYTITWSYMNGLLNRGYRRQLNPTDFDGLAKQDTSLKLTMIIQKKWDEEVVKAKKHGRNPSLSRVYFSYWWRGLSLNFLWAIAESACLIIMSLAVGWIIDFFDKIQAGENPPISEGYISASFIAIPSIILCLTHHQYFFYSNRYGMQMRLASIGLVYNKSLRLSQEAFQQTTRGQIANLISNDCIRFDNFGTFIVFVFVAPIEGIIVIYLLLNGIGTSALYGFALLLLLVPWQLAFGRLFARFRDATAQLTDIRIRHMMEVISGMRLIKISAWERPYKNKITKSRADEIGKIRNSNMLRATNMSIFFVSTTFVGAATFLGHYYSGNELNSKDVFVTLGLLGVTKRSATLFLPFAIEAFSQVRISMRRITTFLSLPEVHNAHRLSLTTMDEILKTKKHNSIIAFSMKKYQAFEDRDHLEVKDSKSSSTIFNNDDISSNPIIIFDHISASWSNSDDDSCLHDISFRVEPGDLLGVVGPVGCGKTAVLLAILGELHFFSRKQKKTPTVHGSFAYCQQEPWIMSGTVKENIIMGLNFDSDRFDQVMVASALKPDLKQFDNGIETLIGSRGVTLSGGQRARIGLARALYADKDIYLLDDPLSAVDPATGSHIFRECIQKFLGHKIVVLVTHQVHFLSQAKNIILLKQNGHISAQGSYQELSKNASLNFMHTIEHIDRESERVSSLRHSTNIENEKRSIALSSTRKSTSIRDPTEDGMPNLDVAAVIQTEDRLAGSVSLDTVLSYMKSGGSMVFFVIVLFLGAAAQGIQILTDWWLSEWAQGNVEGSQATSIYGVFIAVTAILGTLFLNLIFVQLLEMSKNLHNSMAESVIRAPIAFFVSNPVGRILNRFSNDVGIVDELLPSILVDLVRCTYTTVGAIILCCTINPLVILPLLPLIIALVLYRRYYIRTSREIKRLEAVSRSPVHSLFSATLDGLVTVRSFQIEMHFFSLFTDHQDANTRAYIAFLMLARWFGARLDLLSAIFISVIAYFSIFAKDSMSPALIGLSLTWAITLMGMFQWCVRQSAEAENHMVSVERIVTYKNLNSEPPLELPADNYLDADWPTAGKIEFKDLSFSYADQPAMLKTKTKQSPESDQPKENVVMALQNITCVILPTQKVGVVGRTGAGKSSLLSTVLRLIRYNGVISIDGQNITQIGLHRLRTGLSIIPQEPILFSGTLRYNLDPMNATNGNDNVLLSALEQVQMRHSIELLPKGLDYVVETGGSNFSVGERQLLCLARAIARKTRILLMDEATANVDYKTDAIIQKAIRTRFINCTVMVIAHRLKTIIDCDRIMVLDAGNLIEFDHPHVLLQNKKGKFSDMVKETGSLAKELRKLASSAYQLKTKNIEQKIVQHEKKVDASTTRDI